MADHRAWVRYTDGRAEVHIDRRRFSVDVRDNDRRSGCCPIELIYAALGS